MTRASCLQSLRGWHGARVCWHTLWCVSICWCCVIAGFVLCWQLSFRSSQHLHVSLHVLVLPCSAHVASFVSCCLLSFLPFPPLPFVLSVILLSVVHWTSQLVWWVFGLGYTCHRLWGVLPTLSRVWGWRPQPSVPWTLKLHVRCRH